MHLLYLKTFLLWLLFLAGITSPLLGQGSSSMVAPDFPDLSATLRSDPSRVIERVEAQFRIYQGELSPRERVQLYLLLGKAYTDRDSFRSGLFAFQRGLEEATNSDRTADRTKFLTEIGNVYNQLNETIEAEKILREAEESGKLNDHPELLGSIYDALAETQLLQNSLKRAGESLEQAIIYKRDYNDSIGIGVTFNLYARLKMAEKEISKAQEYLELAIDTNQKEGRFQEVAESYLIRAEISRFQKNPALLLLNARAALDLAQKNGIAEVERQSLREMSFAHAELGDFQEAYQSLESYTILQTRYLENLRGEEFARARTSLLSEVDQQQREILEKENQLKNAELAQQEALLARKRIETYSLIIGIVCLLVLVVVFFIQAKVRRRNDDQLMKINTDLKDALDHSQQLQAAAEAASAAKSQFLANMSHEIRTPLNAVIGMSTILNDTKLTDEQSRYLKSIQASSNGLLSLLNDLLDFSKIESGMLDIESIPFDLENLLEEIIDMMQPSVESKGIKLLLEFQDPLPQALMGDPSRLRQILINLIGNAIKFTFQGYVKLSLSQKTKVLEGIVVQFCVEDSGIGIESDRVEGLFDPFTQVDNSHTRKFGGSGLGLSICKRLTELMDGEIWVESEPNKGSRFYFTVPLKVDRSANYIDAVGELARGKRLLVADDNDTNRRILRIYGERVGMKVDEADNAYGALNLLQNSPLYDLAIIDFQMPGMDGIELIKRIREMDRGRLPLLMLSSAGDKAIHDAALEAGANDYLNKPVKREVLFSAMQKILSQLTKPEKKQESPKEKEALSDLWKSKRDIRILLAEDNPMNQRVATIMLNRMGLSCKVVDDGLTAVNAVNEEPFDLVLMDLQMPVMDGLEAARKIRSGLSEKFTQPVIVAMTAAATKEDEAEAMNAGMDAFLTKPVRASSLAEVLQEKLHERHKLD